MANKSQMGLHASALASAGWPVFPCHPKTKRPLTPKASAPGKKDGGLYLATTDELQVARWWKQHPDALIGVPTGEKIGAFVVDLDPRTHGVDDMLGDLVQWCGGNQPDSFTGIDREKIHISRTQSGGYHLWFALPHPSPGVKGIGNRANLFKNIDDVPIVIADHVDVRGEGGYVIVPPSVMADGNKYEWINPVMGLADHELRPCPARLLDVILRVGEFENDGQGGGDKSGDRQPAGRTAKATDAQHKYALTALHGEINEVSSCASGGRNSRLNEAAVKLGALVGAGVLSEAVVRASLIEAASSCGLVKDDGRAGCLKTIESGLTFGISQPRDMSDIGTAFRGHGQRNTGDPGPAPLGGPGTAHSDSSSPHPPEK